MNYRVHRDFRNVVVPVTALFFQVELVRNCEGKPRIASKACSG